MTNTLPFLLASALLAASQAPEHPAVLPAASTAPGNQLLTQAAEQLLRHETFQTKMRQRVELFGQTLAGSGIYLQKPSPRGLLLRMEWKLPIGQHVATIQQVSDGRFLWLRRELPDGAMLSRVDLHQVRQHLQQSGQEGLVDAGLNILAFGGLPRLVQNLTQNFDFQPAQQAQLGPIPVWIVQGTWTTEKLLQITPHQALQGQSDLSRHLASLPPHLPTHVQVVIGQDDLIPYRVDYLRREQPAVQPSGEAATGLVRLATIELLEPLCGEPLDDQLFAHQPGLQEVADQTELYLQSLLPAPR